MPKQFIRAMKSVSQKKTNRLFQSLIAVSLMIHIFVFIHVAELYHSRTLSFIEISLEDLSKPFSREIPRPRMRPKNMEKPRDMEKLEIKKQVMPPFKTIRISPVDAGTSAGITENISVSNLLSGSGLDLAGWDPNAMADMKEILTRKDYYDLVKLRIESHKKYPQMAKMRRAEGSVTVQFVISLDGKISAMKVVNTSRKKVLDEAAIEAVQDAAPFSKPPLKFFSEPIAVEVVIVFEIT